MHDSTESKSEGWEIFILDRVDELTSSYHPEGGLVVVARGLDEAKLLVVETPDTESWRDKKLQQPTDGEWAAAKRLPLAGEQDPAVHVHPDSGCC